MKNIAILGSTGSIGKQTLEIVNNNPDIKVTALTCNKSIELLEHQARSYHPEIVAVWSKECADSLRIKLADTDIKVYDGMEGMIAAATLPKTDMVVTAFVGMIGILPTMAAIEAGKDIALANKETLVTAGHLIMPLAKKKGVSILPVDSEHSAIFQSIEGNRKLEIDKILLTASGGPFRGKKIDELKNMGLKDALTHPNWSMGNKITIDSATLVNKALEVMEASWLFKVPLEKIQIIVHPESIIHSMVQYNDGAIIAQLGVPDMKLPIQYALFYPDRRTLPGKRVDFAGLSKLTFENPDIETFRGLALGLEAARVGGSMPTVFNAANEAAVAGFLAGKIGFTDIWRLIEGAMQGHKSISSPSLSEILEIEKESRSKVSELCHDMK